MLLLNTLDKAAWATPLIHWRKAERTDTLERYEKLGITTSHLSFIHLCWTNLYVIASPLFAKVFLIRPLVPYLVKLGPRSFRRMIINMMPVSMMQKGKRVIDTLYDESTSIYESKKEALLKGEEAVVQQVGKGKDILSILCEFSHEPDWSWG